EREAHLSFVGAVRAASPDWSREANPGAGALGREATTSATVPDGFEGTAPIVLLLDVGGASSELALGEPSGEILRRTSISLGAVTATKAWLRSDPVIETELDALAAELNQRLAADTTLVALRAFARPVRAVAVGGTATSVAAIELGLATYDRNKVQGF